MPYHKLCVIGKLVSDPKSRDLPSGGKVATFGLPIDFTRRKKNPQTGEWEGDSFIINVDVFNRDNRPLADWVMQSLKKGSQVYVEGRLKNNEYTDKNNVKVARPVLVADVIEFLDPRADGMGGPAESSMGGMSSAPPRRAEPAAARAPANNNFRNSGGDDLDDMGSAPGRSSGGGSDDDIPF